MNQNPLSVSQDRQSYKNRLISTILADFNQQYGLDLSQDPAALERISEAIDQAVLDLETNPVVEINLPYISANQAGPIHLRRIISRKVSSSSSGMVDIEGEKVPVQGTSNQRVKIQLPERKPYITTALLVIMAVFYALQWFTDLVFGYDLLAIYGMKSNELIIAGEYWRLVTAMFLHGSIIHLGFNLYALYILGRRVERFFGSFRFLALFLIAGIAGNLFSFAFTEAPSLGSSTAIFGLLGAEGVFIYQHRKLFGEQFKVALRQIIQVAVGNLVIGWMIPGIDNMGHVGGLIGGALYTWFSGPKFTIANSPPEFRLEDQRPEEKALYAFFALLILIICLVVWIIFSRT
ncbi:MAG: rhomboid family intramembrane serine protease [Anaerolineales bacterium]|nr:rhomboid family intramembrane serine protease [Anaerolineales bacterium]